MTLGRDKVDNFSGESGGSSYRDYKDIQPFLVNDDDFKHIKPKDLKVGTKYKKYF